MLLPMNCMFAAYDWYPVIFPNYEPTIVLTFAVSGPIFIVQMIIFFFMQGMPSHVKLSGPFAINTLIAVGLVMVPLSFESEKTGYYLTVALACLFGVSYAFLQFGLYGAAGPSASLTNSLNVGLGCSSLGLNALRMLLLATVTDLNTSTEIFFFISVGYLAICTALAYRFSKILDSLPKSNWTEQDNSTKMNKVISVLKRNWKEALGMTVVYTVQMVFFPGPLLNYQWSFI
jgi:hypothetical protein